MRSLKWLFFILIALAGCNSDDSKSTGQVTFSGEYSDGKNSIEYTVTIDGKTISFEGGDAPECGTISTESANFVLPAGNYSFTFTNKKTNFFDEKITSETYSAQKSVTIPEGGCVSVRWD